MNSSSRAHPVSAGGGEGSAVQERNELARAYLGLTAVLHKIVRDAPQKEPDFIDPYGGYVRDGNQEDVAEDAARHAEWRIAQLIAGALYEFAPDGGVDVWAAEISEAPTPRTADAPRADLSQPETTSGAE